jgi:hypothetical protein
MRALGRRLQARWRRHHRSPTMTRLGSRSTRSTEVGNARSQSIIERDVCTPPPRSAHACDSDERLDADAAQAATMPRSTSRP